VQANVLGLALVNIFQSEEQGKVINFCATQLPKHCKAQRLLMALGH